MSKIENSGIIGYTDRDKPVSSQRSSLLQQNFVVSRAETVMYKDEEEFKAQNPLKALQTNEHRARELHFGRMKKGSPQSLAYDTLLRS